MNDLILGKIRRWGDLNNLMVKQQHVSKHVFVNLSLKPTISPDALWLQA